MGKKPVWISHRGYCRVAAENSRVSFQAAVERGFGVLETDLRTTKDGIVVLAHDRDLFRLTGYRLLIDQISFAELADIRLKDGQSILTLSRFIKEFVHQDWIFDIKPESGRQTIDALYDLVRKEGMLERVVHQGRFLFWQRDDQDYFYRLFPEGRCLATMGECYRAGIACLLGLSKYGRIEKGKTYSLPPRFVGIDLYRERLIKQYHLLGARVLSYLPRTVDQVKTAILAGVDEILTDGEVVRDVE